MGIGDGIVSEMMGALERLEAILILRDIANGTGSLGGRTGGGGVPGGLLEFFILPSSNSASLSFLTVP